MKKLVYLYMMFFLALSVHAQSEEGKVMYNESQVKDFGGFLLDMGTILNRGTLVVSPPFLTTRFSLPLSEEINYRTSLDAFKPYPNIIDWNGTLINPSSSFTFSPFYSRSGMVNWQGTSYKLNNGMRINLYGEYDTDGNKVYNPSALPWQRNNFNAAFEMKSANGKFGIKVEVHGGRNNLY